MENLHAVIGRGWFGIIWTKNRPQKTRRTLRISISVFLSWPIAGRRVSKIKVLQQRLGLPARQGYVCINFSINVDKNYLCAIVWNIFLYLPFSWGFWNLFVILERFSFCFWHNRRAHSFIKSWGHFVMARLQQGLRQENETSLFVLRIS